MAGETRVLEFDEGVTVAAADQSVTLAKNNYTATTDPGVGDDDQDGYGVGSIWINNIPSPKKKYICLDNSTGAAVWSWEVDQTGEQELSNKKLTGGTASAQRVWTLPGDTNANLTALGRVEKSIYYDETNDNVLVDDGTILKTLAFTGASFDYSSFISNLGLSVAMAANAVTIALKQKDGTSDPTGANTVGIGFRSSTLTSGAYNIRTVNSSLSTVISSGSTAGTADGTENKIYIYAIDNSGTVELAWSRKQFFNEEELISTTAEGGAGAADSNRVMYSTTARSNVPFRLIGGFVTTQTTAGTWATAASNIFVGTKETIPKESIVVEYGSVSSQSLTANVTNIDFVTKGVDPYNAWDGDTFTAIESKYYRILSLVQFSSSVNIRVQSYVNSTLSKTLVDSQGPLNRYMAGGGEFLNAGDTLSLRVNGAATANGVAADHFISIVEG